MNPGGLLYLACSWLIKYKTRAMIVPLYNSEVSPPEIRGALVSLQQLAICFGIMVSFW